MPIVVDTNSYVDIAAADAYFVDRYGSAAWDALTDPDKESALLSAMPMLEGYCTWSGEKTDDAQALEFPRDGDTEVPQDIKNAQCELGLSVVNAGGPTGVSSAPLKRLKADTAELEWMDNYTKEQVYFNSYVTGFLDGYCEAGTTGGGTGDNSVIRV